jgi:hypothetical protein
MINYKLKDITHFEFFNQLKLFNNEIEELMKQNDLDLDIFKTKSAALKETIKNFLENNLNIVDQNILNFLEVGKITLADDFLFNYNIKRLPQIEIEIEYLKKYKNQFSNLVDYFSIVESFFNEESTMPESIIDKTEFLLNCINKLFGDNSYSVKTIFDFNKIKYRDNEPIEIAEDLARRKYVTVEDRIRSKDKVKISIKGASYVERKSKQLKKTKRNDELNNKIDSIIDHLKKLGYGQEIIFDEIEELRELDGKLSKKSWRQLLKSKLFDLAVEEVINKDVAKEIYEYLTKESFKFLQ